MTDQAAAIMEGPRFSIGQVLEDSFETLLRIFPQLLAIVAIIAVPLLVWLVLGGEPILVRFAVAGGIEADTFDPVMAILILLIGLIALEINGAVSDATFRHLLGDAGDLLQALSRALLATPSLLAAWLFLAILFGISFFMLALAAGLLSNIHWILSVIVGLPGLTGLVALMVRWCVLVPAIVIEQTNPIAGFARSSGLTEGNRWKVFALLLIVYVPEVIVKLLLLVAAPLVGLALVGVINIALSGLFIAFNALVTVVIYAHLRAIKEGSGTAELAEVFE